MRRPTAFSRRGIDRALQTAAIPIGEGCASMSPYHTNSSAASAAGRGHACQARRISAAPKPASRNQAYGQMVNAATAAPSASRRLLEARQTSPRRL